MVALSNFVDAKSITLSRRHFLRTSSVSVRTMSSWSVDSDSGIISSTSKDLPRFQTVIGLEIHAQLNIATKLFSGCPRPTSLFAKPNSHVWPFDVGVPGFLPRLSKEAVQYAVLSAAALKCDIPPMSRFERKHYFYADLPMGFQITQQRWPVARDGVLICHSPSKKKGKKKKSEASFTARIERIQLEQDTGKTIMMPQKDGTTNSLVDFNRAGCALIEIVFHPDLRSSSQAASAVETLRSLLRHIGTCDGKMEEGSLRCDLNVSIAPLEEDKNDDGIVKRTGNRVEVKNLNSIRQVQMAAEYEAVRQVEAHMKGEPTRQETRTFEVKSGKTRVIRTKEGSKDYRFMPEPDMPPIVLDQKALDGHDLQSFLQERLPELPDEARGRLQADYQLSPYMASVLTNDPPAIQMFDEAVEEAKSQTSGKIAIKTLGESAANLLCNELYALVRKHETTRALAEDENSEASVKFSMVSGKQLGVIAALLTEGTISSTMAKQLLRIVHNEEQGKDPRVVANDRGFKLIQDQTTLMQLCSDVIDENPKEMEKYKMGGKFAGRITKFLLGKAMQKSAMNAHPERLSEIMVDLLEKLYPDVSK